MRLTVEKRDLRWMDGGVVEIVDENGPAGDGVGQVRYEKGVGRHISLYGGRYTGTVQTHEECVAFIKGVETVLNYMIE